MGILSKLFGSNEIVDEYLTGYETGYMLREEHPELNENSRASEKEQARLQVEASKNHSYHDDDTHEDAFYAFGNGVYDGIVRNEPQLPEDERPWWKVW